jgi:predicted DNA-binding protein
MEVSLPPELEEKLNRLADRQGRSSESLVCDAVERLVGQTGWSVRADSLNEVQSNRRFTRDEMNQR